MPIRRTTVDGKPEPRGLQQPNVWEANSISKIF